MNSAARFGEDHVSGLAVHPSIDDMLAVASDNGAVHSYRVFARERSWDTRLRSPRVCWVGDEILAWDTRRQAFLLGAGVEPSPLDALENCDLAVAGRRLLAASRASGLFSLQLSGGQVTLREHVRAAPNYLEGSLTTSRFGATAFIADGCIHYQPRADGEWQVVQKPCQAIRFSRDGRKLALVQARGTGTQIALVSVADDDRLGVEHPIPVFDALANTVVALDWSLDGASLLLLGVDGELEIRDVRTVQLTFSTWVRGMARFYARPDLLITGDPKGLEAINWKPREPKLWIRLRSGSVAQATLGLVGSARVHRGDKVLLLLDDPVLRPAALYEVTDGLRTLNPSDRPLPNPVNAILRVTLPQLSLPMLAQERALIQLLADVHAHSDTRSSGVHEGTVQLLYRLFPRDSAAGHLLREQLALTENAQEPSPPSRLGRAPNEGAEGHVSHRQAMERAATLLDRLGYVLLERIGGGAGGDVYRAQERRDSGVDRAIKILDLHPWGDLDDLKPRFRSEASALCKVEHRAIVRYVSAGDADGTLYLVMDYVQGRPLHKCRSELSFEKRISVVTEILGALGHAHAQGIRHRDIKPSNIVVRDSDQQPVLVDFGLAYMLGDEIDDGRTRHALGTPGYIPPEVPNNPKKSRSPKHDVFQVGVVLFEMFAGQLPDHFISLGTIDPRLAGLDVIVQRAIAPEEERYESAEAFVSDLRAWQLANRVFAEGEQ